MLPAALPYQSANMKLEVFVLVVLTFCAWSPAYCASDTLASLRLAGGTRCPQRVGNGLRKLSGLMFAPSAIVQASSQGEADPPSPKELIPADLAAFVLFL